MSEAQLRPAGKPGIKLDVRDDGMIVTLPGTSYTVTYCSPQLLAQNLSTEDDGRSEMIYPTSWLVLGRATSAGWVRSRRRKSNARSARIDLASRHVACGGLR